MLKIPIVPAQEPVFQGTALYPGEVVLLVPGVEIARRNLCVILARLSAERARMGGLAPSPSSALQVNSAVEGRVLFRKPRVVGASQIRIAPLPIIAV